MTEFTIPDPALSNSLCDLAARFKVEHRACIDAMRDSVAHAIAAGEILIEAKAQLKHGQWLPWLKEHCGDVAERTAQLYMRAAKNRATIETEIRNAIADLSLNEAMALLALSSDVRKVLEFAKQAEARADNPDAFIKNCLDLGFVVVQDESYDVWFGTTEAEKHEWHVFILYLIERHGYEIDGACAHVEWIRQKDFRNVYEWIGPVGEKWRRSIGWPATNVNNAWQAFAAPLREKPLAEIYAMWEGAEERLKARKAARKRKRSKKAAMKQAAA